MDNTEFPTSFPDVGGMNFLAVATDPKYNTFCEFVQKRMENCTGLFLEFQRYLSKGHDIRHHTGNGVSHANTDTVQ